MKLISNLHWDNNKKNIINIMVNLFHWFLNAFCLALHFHVASLCKTAESSAFREKELPPPATPPLWALCGAVLTALWPSVCSRSGSSTASLCPYFLQLSAFLEGFFMVMILLLGSGNTLIKCYEPEIKIIIKKLLKNYHHSLLIMW